MNSVQTSAAGERLRFIREYQARKLSMTELCLRFGISRITGYKWLRRYQEAGQAGLQDRSRAPHSHPNQVLQEVESAVIASRAQHPLWGPVKLRRWLEREAPEITWPAPSTIGEILRRNGLSGPVNKLQRRRA
jgi:transposase